MEQRELTALVKLLDDDDPEVSQHVWARLKELGQHDVERLEAVWEMQEDPLVQQRLEELIHQINLKEVARDLLKWRKEGGKDLLEGWGILSRFLFPELHFQSYKNELNRLVNKSWLEIRDSMEPGQKLRVLNHILFVMERYEPYRDERNPALNYINQVFDQKKGNYITINLLYMLISQRLELPVSAVILPGYFMLIWRDSYHEFFIDVYNEGRFVKKDELKRFMTDNQIEQKAAFFKPTSNIYIILQMIRNMIGDYEAVGDESKVEDLEQLLKDIEISFD